MVAIHPALFDPTPMQPGEFVDAVASTVVTGGFRLWVQSLYRRWAPVWLRRLHARRFGHSDASEYLEIVAAQSDQAVLIFSEIDLRSSAGWAATT